MIITINISTHNSNPQGIALHYSICMTSILCTTVHLVSLHVFPTICSILLLARSALELCSSAVGETDFSFDPPIVRFPSFTPDPQPSSVHPSASFIIVVVIVVGGAYTIPLVFRRLRDQIPQFALDKQVIIPMMHLLLLPPSLSFSLSFLRLGLDNPGHKNVLHSHPRPRPLVRFGSHGAFRHGSLLVRPDVYEEPRIGPLSPMIQIW